MIIRQPITATPDPRNRWQTFLHFESGERLKSYVRGAIAWPEGSREGFAMMAGQDVSTGMIYIYKQASFWTISHWLNPDGSLRPKEQGGFHFGLIQAMEDWQAIFKCASFFFGGQHVDVMKRHSLELYRSPLRPKNLQLIEVPYVSEVGDDLIKEKLKTRRFSGQYDSQLHKAVDQWLKLESAGVGDNNIIHCLRALLAGFEHQPFVKLEAA